MRNCTVAERGLRQIYSLLQMPVEAYAFGLSELMLTD